MSIREKVAKIIYDSNPIYIGEWDTCFKLADTILQSVENVDLEEYELTEGEYIKAQRDWIEHQLNHEAVRHDQCVVKAQLAKASSILALREEKAKKEGKGEVMEWVRQNQIPDKPECEPYPGLVVISKIAFETKLEEYQLPKTR